MNCSPEPEILVGLADADLLDDGTRHPNIALLKIAGFLNDNSIPFELIESATAATDKYAHIFLSKVFTFTKDPAFFSRDRERGCISKYHCGGTGFYHSVPDAGAFRQLRIKDMASLENDSFLNQFPNKRGGKPFGIDMARQMPFYDLYKQYIQRKVEEGRPLGYFKDYLYYSIGFLTRGCFRKCHFCVNRLENKARPYSRLQWFLDNSRDEKGHLQRPYIYLWDDNFLASPPSVWRRLLDELIETGRPFQFRQGLDLRILAESPHGEEIARKLSQCKYHGDYIFAFDNWSEREKIIKGLKIWKFHNKKETKLYLFCGYEVSETDDETLYREVWEIFQRIKIIMQYGCLGYIMRHENYQKHKLGNIFVQIARWCNQPGFYRNLSFWEFCYKNQSYWEKKVLKKDAPAIKTYADFGVDYNNGYYEKIKICKTLRTTVDFIDHFANHKAELLEMFNYRLRELRRPDLWAR